MAWHCWEAHELGQDRAGELPRHLGSDGATRKWMRLEVPWAHLAQRSSVFHPAWPTAPGMASHTPSTAKGTACLPAPHRSGLEAVPGPQRLPNSHLRLSGKGPVRAGSRGAPQEDSQEKAGSPAQDDGRGALGSGRRAGGSMPRPPRLGRLKDWGQPPSPAPLPQTCLCRVCWGGGGLSWRLELAWGSLGFGFCCEMGPRISCFRISVRLPTGCLGDVLPQWPC